MCVCVCVCVCGCVCLCLCVCTCVRVWVAACSHGVVFAGMPACCSTTCKHEWTFLRARSYVRLRVCLHVCAHHTAHGLKSRCVHIGACRLVMSAARNMCCMRPLTQLCFPCTSSYSAALSLAHIQSQPTLRACAGRHRAGGEAAERRRRCVCVRARMCVWHCVRS